MLKFPESRSTKRSVSCSKVQLLRKVDNFHKDMITLEKKKTFKGKCTFIAVISIVTIYGFALQTRQLGPPTCSTINRTTVK